VSGGGGGGAANTGSAPVSPGGGGAVSLNTGGGGGGQSGGALHVVAEGAGGAQHVTVSGSAGGAGGAPAAGGAARSIVEGAGGAQHTVSEAAGGASHSLIEGGSQPVSGGAGHFTLSTGAVMPSPASHVQPMEASHFHGPRTGHVSNSPTRAEVISKQTLPYEPLRLQVLWDVRPPEMNYLVNWADVIKTPSPELVRSAQEVHLSSLQDKGVGQLVYDFSTHITEDRSSTLRQEDNSRLTISSTVNASQSSSSSTETSYSFQKQVTNSFDFSTPAPQGGIYVDPLNVAPDQVGGRIVQAAA
jgi:hypothetical protein